MYCIGPRSPWCDCERRQQTAIPDRPTGSSSHPRARPPAARRSTPSPDRGTCRHAEQNSACASTVCRTNGAARSRATSSIRSRHSRHVMRSSWNFEGSALAVSQAPASPPHLPVLFPPGTPHAVDRQPTTWSPTAGGRGGDAIEPFRRRRPGHRRPPRSSSPGDRKARRPRDIGSAGSGPPFAPARSLQPVSGRQGDPAAEPASSIARRLPRPAAERDGRDRAAAGRNFARCRTTMRSPPNDPARNAPPPHDHHEHILRDVVGGARRSRHVQREPVDLPVPASEQKPEGLRVAFCGPREQILVGVPIGFRILI